MISVCEVPSINGDTGGVFGADVQFGAMLGYAFSEIICDAAPTHARYARFGWFLPLGVARDTPVPIRM